MPEKASVAALGQQADPKWLAMSLFCWKKPTSRRKADSPRSFSIAKSEAFTVSLWESSCLPYNVSTWWWRGRPQVVSGLKTRRRANSDWRAARTSEAQAAWGPGLERAPRSPGDHGGHGAARPPTVAGPMRVSEQKAGPGGGSSRDAGPGCLEDGGRPARALSRAATRPPRGARRAPCWWGSCCDCPRPPPRRSGSGGWG